MSAPIEHCPGGTIFVEFSGDKFTIHDGLTGEHRQVPFFVATHPLSLLIFAIGCEGEHLRNVAIADNTSLVCFGGAQKIVVLDNMKTAVSEPDRYESDIKQVFAQWA